MARRTLLMSSRGEKGYVVRDQSGKFEYIHQTSRARAMDIRRGSAAEPEGAATDPGNALKCEPARRPADERTVARAVRRVARRASLRKAKRG